MNSASRISVGKHAKFVAAAFALIGVIRLVEFVTSGRALDDALAGAGFVFMAYGVFRNGFVTEERNAGGRYAALAGAVLLVASVLVPVT